MQPEGAVPIAVQNLLEIKCLSASRQDGHDQFSGCVLTAGTTITRVLED